MDSVEQLFRLLGSSNGWRPEYTFEAMALSLLMAFVIGQLIAWVYQWTHSGLSYSRTFTQSLVLITMVVSLVMFVIGDSVITAFGLIGALAIIRFRNVLKDTRDTSFIFFALVLGMALGSQRYLAAVTGTAFLLVVSLYLHATAFGSRGLFDGHLSCRMEGVQEQETFHELSAVLARFCRRLKTVTVRHGEDLTEYVYQVRLRDRRLSEEMVQELRAIAGVGNVALVLRDELAEV